MIIDRIEFVDIENHYHVHNAIENLGGKESVFKKW